MNNAGLPKLQGLYISIKGEIAGFRELSNLACPEGCGRCCDRADTEVFPLEAEIIARYLEDTEPLSVGDLAGRVADQDRVECVFYDGKAKEHCMVYPARPLICRAYGDYGIRDKLGTLYFDVCPFLVGADRFASGGGLVRVPFPPYPPVLGDYEEKIRELHAKGAATKRPLGAAVLRVLRGDMSS